MMPLAIPWRTLQGFSAQAFDALSDNGLVGVVFQDESSLPPEEPPYKFVRLWFWGFYWLEVVTEPSPLPEYLPDQKMVSPSEASTL